MEKTQLQQQKESIVNKIQQIEKFDIDKISVSKKEFGLWQNLESQEVSNIVREVFILLKNLKSRIDILDTAQIGFVPNLDSNLQNLMNSYANNLQNTEYNGITTQNHETLSWIQNIYNQFWTTPLINELKEKTAKVFSEEIKKVLPTLNRLLTQEDVFKKASDSAFNWLQSKGKLDEMAVRDQANAFLNRADDHKIHNNQIKFLSFRFSGNWWWLLSSLIFALITGLITFSFLEIMKEETDISLGQALLRITSLLVPAYLTAFCSSQFLYHKKMFESYMFKYASLNTMNHLMNTSGDASQKERILNKGLDVLFSEPKTKESSDKQDKVIVSELLSMLRTQLK